MVRLKIKKLLVVALKAEWSHLKNSYKIEQQGSDHKYLFHIADFPGTFLLQVGFGPKNAGENFKKLLDSYACEGVLHFGSCGALDPGLQVGDLFVGQSLVCNLKDNPIHIDSPYLYSLTKFLDQFRLSYQAGKLLSSDHVLKNRQEKESAANGYQASAVDMESYAIAKICQDNGIDYLAVRGVFDQVDDNLEALGEPYDEQGNLKPARLAVNLIKNPKLILQVPALKKRSDLVNRNLARVVDWYLSVDLSNL